MGHSNSTGRRIGIVGAGAIGGHVAARLALAGHAVSVLARGATLEALTRDGVRYRTGGSEQCVPVRAVEDMGPQELLVIAVKGQSLPALAPLLAPAIDAATTILPLGNGLPWWYFLMPGIALSGLRLRRVDPAGAIERALPFDQVLGGSVFASCHTPAPGVVVHSSGDRMVLGEPTGGVSDRAQLWASVLDQAGLGASAREDIRGDIWLKLLGNACVNPLSLLTCATSDKLVNDAAARAVFARMMAECIELGRALGLTIDTDPEQRIAQTGKLGAIRTSMLQDFQAGRGVELDAILGAPLECAAALQMPLPQMEAVFALACLRAREAGLYA